MILKNDAGRQFLEWASLFSGGIFVKAVTVYADESGTHDKTGKATGSTIPVIAGFAAPPSEWSKFCVDWKAVLNAYGVPYFHSKEVRAAKADLEHGRRVDTGNPYHRLSMERLEKFIFTLAEIAGRGNKVPIAGAIKTPAFHKWKAELEISNPENIQLGNNPYKFSMGMFFHGYHSDTWHRWGDFKCPVSFFFDQHPDPEWRSAVFEVFDAFKKKDKRLAELAFVPKEKMPHLPLQAADMLAYRVRQISERRHLGKPVTRLPIDTVLFAGLFKGIPRPNLFEPTI